jgi:DNA-binding NtrC family response regulator
MDRKTILIVDDDDSTRLSLVALLESEAVTLRTAATMEEAETELRSSVFDLVITDLHLTGRASVEGLDLISKVKAETPQTHVVLFTGFGSAEIEREAKDRGATDYWEKTIAIPTLVARVKALGIPVGRVKSGETL